MSPRRRLTVRLGEDDALALGMAAREARDRLSGSIKALEAMGGPGPEIRRLERRLWVLGEVTGRHG